MTTATATDKRRQLLRDGFCLFEGILDPDLLEQTLFWHRDWWGWNHPVSYGDPVPQQVFLMYYTVDTTPGNGCLRLIPGSHLERHPMHDAVPDAYGGGAEPIEWNRIPGPGLRGSGPSHPELEQQIGNREENPVT